MTIFVYLCSGLPERQGSKMASVTGEGIAFATEAMTRAANFAPQHARFSLISITA
jgi:hypothetical protein